jgi:hypothetical protein
MSQHKIFICFLIALQGTFASEINLQCWYKNAPDKGQTCQIIDKTRITSNVKKISFYGAKRTHEDDVTVDYEVNESLVDEIQIYYTPIKVFVPQLFSSIVSKFPKTKTIRVYSSQIQEIKPGTFQTRSEVANLFLYHNNIETVRNGSFDGLEEILAVLKIHSCNTNHIESGVFTDLKKLEVLILTGNELTSLEKNLFANLGELKRLELSRNKFKVLHHGYFRKNFKLDNIKFGGNQIEAISPKFFAGIFMPTLISFRYNPCNYRNETFNSQSDALDGLQNCIENYREKYSKGSKMKISSFWLLFSFIVVDLFI